MYAISIAGQARSSLDEEQCPEYALGVYCTLAGALMLVASHRLAVAPLLQIETNLAWWGIAHLVAGLGVLVSIALPTPRGVGLLALLAGCLLIVGTAMGLALEGRWTGTLACGIFVLALSYPLLRSRRPERDRRQILEAIARHRPLPEVLTLIVQVIERQLPGRLGSILLLGDDRLYHTAAPSLPAAYVAVAEGIPIGPAAGSCGTAAYTCETVVVEDIAASPLWTQFGPAAIEHGLRACWSSPILSSTRGVLGTFALYCTEPAGPTDHERDLIQGFADLTTIAIESDLLLAEMAQRRQANRAKSELLATMSHEIRTP